MEVLSNYDYNKKFISPEHFLDILTNINNIYNYKIIQVPFKYLIDNIYLQDCYTATIIYQYILSKKIIKTNIYNNLFFLETKNEQVYINYITTKNDLNDEKNIYTYPISIEYFPLC
jgi:ABC-type metal ion transport system substrate-binding protein